VILIIILYALVAITFPLAQYAIRYADPFFVVGVRMIVAGALLLGIHKFLHKKSMVIQEGDFLLFVKTALFHVFLAFVPEFWALQYLSPLKVNIMFSATPFITALLEIFLWHKTFTLSQLVGMAIGTSGVLFLALSTTQPHCTLLTCMYPLLPEALLMVAIISAAYAWFVINQLRQRGYQLVFINGVAMLLGGIMSMLTIPFFGNTSALIISWPGFLITTILLMIISNGLVYQLYGTLLMKYRPTLLSLAGFLCPLFGTAYAILLFGESLTVHYAISLALVFIGLCLFCRRN